MGRLRGALDVVDRAGGIGRVAHGHQLGLLAEKRLPALPVDGAGRQVDRRLADHDAAVGQQLPRASIALVVELRDKYLVAGLEGAGDALRQQDGQRGHVGAETDFVRIAAEEVGQGATAAVDDGIGLFAGGEHAMDVAVVVDEVVRHGIQHALRHLGAAWAVEVSGGKAIDGASQSRELRPDVIEIEALHAAGSFRWEGGLPRTAAACSGGEGCSEAAAAM